MQTANTTVPVQFTGRHISVTDAMKAYALGKVGNLRQDFPRIMEVHIILSTEKHRHIAEMVLHCSNHITIEAKEESDDMYASIDKVIDRVARQMRKHKTRVILRNQRPRRNMGRDRFDTTDLLIGDMNSRP